LTPELREQLAEGIADETAGRGISDLEVGATSSWSICWR
jgi:hypothetical protein